VVSVTVTADPLTVVLDGLAAQVDSEGAPVQFTLTVGLKVVGVGVRVTLVVPLDPGATEIEVGFADIVKSTIVIGVEPLDPE